MKNLISLSLILIAVFISPFLSFADDIIQGHYCYTYGDNESLKEARDLTRSLATRNAIESYRVFITSTSNIKNFQLTNDLVQIISSGYLRDIKVIEHKEQGRTICETIQAKVVSPEGINYSIEVNKGNWIRIKEEKLEDAIIFAEYDESSIKFISRDVLTVRMKSTTKVGNIIVFLKITEFRLGCNCAELPDCKGRLATIISEIEFDNFNFPPVWKYVRYVTWLELKPVPEGSVVGIFANKFCPK